MENGQDWKPFKDDWVPYNTLNSSENLDSRLPSSSGVWSMWSHSFLEQVSRSPSVESVFGLGSVLAIKLRDDHNTGYNSNAANGLQERLSKGSDFNIHSRVLGNVFYIMTSQTSSIEVVRAIEQRVISAIS
ncbi:hypothetical protein DH86_00004256 [Scytalidium sp. 3C]|nr:hypothetical protein DH86_00004256 [Scytalidium sp. 3C]